MAPHRFARLLEAELLLRQAPFSRAALQQFVADAWPLIADDPDVQRWARQFLEGRAAAQAPPPPKPSRVPRGGQRGNARQDTSDTGA